jgi:hypothetical protein
MPKSIQLPRHFTASNSLEPALYPPTYHLGASLVLSSRCRKLQIFSGADIRVKDREDLQVSPPAAQAVYPKYTIFNISKYTLLNRSVLPSEFAFKNATTGHIYSTQLAVLPTPVSDYHIISATFPRKSF